jgi:translation initiation factor IF-3
MSHKDLGRQLMDRVLEDLAEVGDLEAPPKDEGMQIIAYFNPKPLKPGAMKETTETTKDGENG